MSDRRKTDPFLSAVPEHVPREITQPLTPWEEGVERKLDAIGVDLTDARIVLGKLETSHDNVLTAVRATTAVVEGVRVAQAKFESRFAWFLVQEWSRTQQTLEKVETHLAARATAQAVLEHDAGGQDALIKELRDKGDERDDRLGKVETAIVVQGELVADARRRSDRNLALVGVGVTVVEIIVGLLLHFLH